MLIVGVSDSQSDGSNMPAISESGSGICSLSSVCVLSFCVPCSFLLTAGPDVLGKRNLANRSAGE
jgi:hypothetical protein